MQYFIPVVLCTFIGVFLYTIVKSKLLSKALNEQISTKELIEIKDILSSFDLNNLDEESRDNLLDRLKAVDSVEFSSEEFIHQLKDLSIDDIKSFFIDFAQNLSQLPLYDKEFILVKEVFQNNKNQKAIEDNLIHQLLKNNAK